MVGKPSRRSETGWKTLLEVRNWSGVPPGGAGVAGIPCQSSGSGREVLPQFRV